jgi:hypothetical protein
LAGGGHGHSQALEGVQGQSFSGLAVGAVALIDGALVVEGKERLDLADDLAAGAMGVENLIKKPKESATQAIDALTAVGALIGLAQQARGQ